MSRPNGITELIAFRGSLVPKFEANILQEIEKLTSKNFSKVYEVKRKNQINVKSKFKIGLATKNQRVSGITLYDCGLPTLPESILNLKSLETLNLERNKLTTLPESISNLKSLETLNLGYNCFTTLPESIANLKSLKALILEGSESTTIPESIKVLEKRGLFIYL